MAAWLKRCRESVGEVNHTSFMQLVESVLLYGVEIWGCHLKLDGLNQLATTKSTENRLWCGCIYAGM